MPALAIEPLDGQNRAGFDCGQPSLNNYLTNSATKAQRDGGARVFLGMLDGHVIGYYTLSANTIAFQQLPHPSRGLDERYPVPAILLGRWAVDRKFAGNGFGSHLMLDAMARSIRVSDDIGASVFVVDPLNDEVREKYQKSVWQFKPLRDANNRLYLPLATLRKVITNTQP